MIGSTAWEPDGGFDEVRASAALADANLPSLLMVLHQLTGDERWLQSPYRPTVTKGLVDHDLGGFSEQVQQEIRDAAVEALRMWHAGAPIAVPAPSEELLIRMMSTCMGEPVPSEYARLMINEMGFVEQPPPVERRPEDLSVIIIGAGISGLTMAVKLREMGLEPVLLEKNSHVGGTWFENDYPGAGVDTPSYLYSWSFFPRNWSTHFGKRDEVVGYVQDMAEHFDLIRSIRFDTEVTAAQYDETEQTWTVTARRSDGGEEQLSAQLLITAVGLLSRPQVPALPGADDFKGRIFHSARWPKDLDVDGQHVAVVGTGASSQQIVPAIAGRAASITVFQRSPQWVAPNENYFRSVSHNTHWLMENVPLYHSWYRFRLAWTYNDKIHASLEIDPTWPNPDRSLNAANDGHRRFFTRYLREQLDGRKDLQDKALPDYPPFGKRMLLDNGWFAALKRPDVELVTDTVTGFSEKSVLTASGEERAADVVVLCTGFDAQRILHPMDIRGRSGRSIREAWGEDDATAYLGISTPDFPNLLFMYGPNTNSGAGGSWVFVAESQTRYIIDLITKMLDKGVGVVECRPEVNETYNRKVDEAHARRIWSHPGMQTYYRNSRGRVVVNTPWRIVDYWDLTRSADLDDFALEPRRGSA